MLQSRDDLNNFHQKLLFSVILVHMCMEIMYRKLGQLFIIQKHCYSFVLFKHIKFLKCTSEYPDVRCQKLGILWTLIVFLTFLRHLCITFMSILFYHLFLIKLQLFFLPYLIAFLLSWIRFAILSYLLLDHYHTISNLLFFSKALDPAIVRLFLQKTNKII